MLEDTLLDLTNRSDIVIDPLLGSGSTLISCEKLGRTAYLCELEPKFCDVIALRWEQATGKKAKRETRQ